MEKHDQLVKRLQRIQVCMANEEEDAVLAAIAAIGDLESEVERLKGVLGIFAAIKADDGDTFDTWNDDVIIRCEVTVGDLKKARSALGAKP